VFFATFKKPFAHIFISWGLMIMAKKKSREIVSSGREVNWVLCLVMSIIFGWFGVDRFIMGKIGTGILKLFTIGGLGIWWLVDIILIATKYDYKNVEWME